MKYSWAYSNMKMRRVEGTLNMKTGTMTIVVNDSDTKEQIAELAWRR